MAQRTPTLPSKQLLRHGSVWMAHRSTPLRGAWTTRSWRHTPSRRFRNLTGRSGSKSTRASPPSGSWNRVSLLLRITASRHRFSFRRGTHQGFTGWAKETSSIFCSRSVALRSTPRTLMATWKTLTRGTDRLRPTASTPWRTPSICTVTTSGFWVVQPTRPSLRTSLLST